MVNTHACPRIHTLCPRIHSTTRLLSNTFLPPTHSGGMIFTFYKARGLKVGSSLVEEDKLELAKNLEEMAKVGSPFVSNVAEQRARAHCTCAQVAPHSSHATPR